MKENTKKRLFNHVKGILQETDTKHPSNTQDQ